MSQILLAYDFRQNEIKFHVSYILSDFICQAENLMKIFVFVFVYFYYVCVAFLVNDNEYNRQGIGSK